MTYIRNVCGDLGLVLRGRLCLVVDNTAAIASCENPGVTARNKHFSEEVHYVRHEYDHGRIRLVFVTTLRCVGMEFGSILDETSILLHRRWGQGPGELIHHNRKFISGKGGNQRTCL